MVLRHLDGMFFFQAEGGIRDYKVTGVQTCALPIWERRLFRREYGPEKLPLYEAYAMIWASDDLQYSGGGTTHGSAYNYYHNVQAARLARVLGQDPARYEREAALIARAMREFL